MAKEKVKERKITKYEKARILGSRALQISMGAPFLVKLTKTQLEDIKYNPLEIAKLEFEKGLVPIEIAQVVSKAKKK